MNDLQQKQQSNKKVVGKDVFITYIKDKDYLCKNTNCHFPVVSMWDIIGMVEQ